MFKYYPFLLLTLCATIQAMDMDDLEGLFKVQRPTLGQIMDKQLTCCPCTRSTATIGCCLTAPLAALYLSTTKDISSLVTHCVTAGVAGSFGYELNKIRSEWYNSDDEDGTNFTEMTTIFPLLMKEKYSDADTTSDSDSGSDDDSDTEARNLLRDQLRAQLKNAGVYEKKNN